MILPIADIVELVGPEHSLQIFGIKLVGLNGLNGHKLLFTVGFVAALLLISSMLQLLARWLLRGFQGKRIAFWTRQVIRIVTATLMILGLVSIWFNDPTRLATFVGLISAGLAFALQKVVTSIAGYIVILRGKTFNVGDRIVMGGVRGDVIALGFIQTTFMEMGQPPAEQADDPAMWVRSRQYTGRIVTVTNDKVFDTPIYNYTREFPYIWEEMRIPISYKDDRNAAERILLNAAEQHTVKVADLSEKNLAEMERRYQMRRSELQPHVYWRLTDNWVELTVRFITKDHEVRALKDKMSRQIINDLDKAKIGIASSTYDIVGMPPIRVVQSP